MMSIECFHVFIGVTTSHLVLQYQWMCVVLPVLFSFVS